MEMEELLIKPTAQEIEFISSVNEMTYYDLVQEAKTLIRKRDMIGLKIAKMAIKACTIKHGGRSEFYTQKDFANDVGIPYKTLSRWTICYRTVVAKIEKHIKTKEDWEKARLLSDRMIKERTIIRKRTKLASGEKGQFLKDMEKPDAEVLEEFRAMSTNSDQLYQCNLNIKRALYNIRQIETKAVRDDNFLFDISENINSFIDTAEKIQSRCVLLIGSKR